MQRFAVIGLGRFGARLAATLAASGQEVIGIDQDVSIIEEMRDRVTLAVAMDSTDERALRGQGIDEVDAAIVSIGTSLEPIILTTVLLKQLGVKRVVARALSPVSARVLQSIGADEVVQPEDEAADRWADRLLTPHLINRFEMGSGYSIVELPTPRAWAGQTLIELDLRRKRDVHVVAVRRPRNPKHPDGPRDLRPLRPDEPLLPDDIVVLMGGDADLAKLPASGR